MKKLLISLIGLIVIAGIVVAIVFLVKGKSEVVVNPTIPTPEPIAMCYQYVGKMNNGYADRAFLKMNITGPGGNQVTGEYQNLPAEKDSKVGTFSGTVGLMDPKISARTADVWWDSMAEGMSVTEQLKIQFGEGSAIALFGEMVDRGDGTYVYKDPAKLTGGFQMSQTDCESLADIITVEKYVRDNIKSIAPEKPVLGGSWYVIIVSVNPVTKTGSVTYEDGHIQGKATFGYVRDGENVTITQVNGKDVLGIVTSACYAYHQKATATAPYAVDEYIDMTMKGNVVSGTKKGTQAGPDMTNGYTGDLDGTVTSGIIDVIFSYTVEGSKNKEKELYKMTSTGIDKMRYPLIEKSGVLVPDTTKEYTIYHYSQVGCKGSN